MTSVKTLWEAIPQVIFDQILMLVGDIDVCGFIVLVSKAHRPSEMVFKFYCYHIFSQQISRPKFDVRKWGDWRSMAINRPRLRLNGLYSFRFVFTKAHCNDAFWEQKCNQSIEVVYFRHIRFLERGELLYCLDILSPHAIAPYLTDASLIKKSERPKVYLGKYLLVRNEVTIMIPMSNDRTMKFKLLISIDEEGYVRGKHNALCLLEHYSTISVGDGNDGNEHTVYYPIPPYNTFKFYRRYWEFNGTSGRNLS